MCLKSMNIKYFLIRLEVKKKYLLLDKLSQSNFSFKKTNRCFIRPKKGKDPQVDK